MRKKGKGFASLADAASALMDLRTSLAGTNAPSRSPDRKPQAAGSDFADIEQQMFAKQAAGQGESTACPPLSTFPARNGAGQRASKPGAKAQKAKNVNGGRIPGQHGGVKAGH